MWGGVYCCPSEPPSTLLVEHRGQTMPGGYYVRSMEEAHRQTMRVRSLRVLGITYPHRKACLKNVFWLSRLVENPMFSRSLKGIQNAKVFKSISKKKPPGGCTLDREPEDHLVGSPYGSGVCISERFTIGFSERNGKWMKHHKADLVSVPTKCGFPQFVTVEQKTLTKVVALFQKKRNQLLQCFIEAGHPPKKGFRKPHVWKRPTNLLPLNRSGFQCAAL